MVNGETIELTTAENDQRLAADAVAQTELDARAWLDGRLSEYPSMGDQMDTIFHSGVDVWKAEIQAIKDKYPKPV